MLLTITSTTPPATDLGFLLHKNPANVRSVDLSFGRAHVVYPHATDVRCTAAVLLEVDAVSLVRRGRARGDSTLADYVNDRPYVASSFLSVAIAKLFGTAMAGRSDDRPELVDADLELEVRVPVLPCRGGEPLLRRLFEPLGYGVAATPLPLDERFPDWGDSRYLHATLTCRLPVRRVLEHLYVLLPVLDDAKHYWVAEDEIEKLLRRGEAWLGDHPERELIARRFLRYRAGLTRAALARLSDDDPGEDPDARTREHDREEQGFEDQVRLRDQRIGTIVAALRASGARRVLDLGCGDGRLLQALLRDGQFERVVGMDVSAAALAVAGRRLHLDTMAPRQRERVELLQGSLTYRDRRLEGYDAAVLMEVVEHLDPDRLGALERSLFDTARPATVILTTPNVEYNARFEGLATGSLRHRDHRFEWTREELRAWAGGVADRNAYSVRFLPVGTEDPEVGAPTQMAVFSR
ncbi:MAG TPA: 3' terminal RNA ribose 2'-O-methyltransferase Hen1 [Actinomycetota bacterium]|jgi:3' terminal RNA ribose 2'-O-methyltransferase Hen1